MQNVICYYLIAGHTWFACGFLFIIVIFLDVGGVFDKRPKLARLAHFLAVLAIPLAGLAGTPVPLWLAIPLVASCLAYVAFGFANKNAKRRFLLGAGATPFVLLVLFLELSLFFWKPPNLSAPKKLFVIGDSLTAGGFGEQTTWPNRIATSFSITVRDLSKPAATTQRALLEQVPKVEKEADANSWVFIEIGGNDLLGETSAADFGKHLDALLAVARGNPSRPRRVIMMELPIPPGRWAFGLWQRRVAAKHGVVLVPRRILAEVLFTEGCTTDTIHLSQVGHDRLAELLMPWLGRP